jgi:SMI1/KNR4 family protein SUKH-1
MHPLLTSIECRGDATDQEIGQGIARLGFEPPADYLEFIRECNGGEGFIKDAGYVRFWAIGQIGEHNKAMTIAEFNPGVVYFGSDGGGLVYGFDTRRRPPSYVEGATDDFEWVREIATDFEGFINYLAEPSR